MVNLIIIHIYIPEWFWQLAESALVAREKSFNIYLCLTEYCYTETTYTFFYKLKNNMYYLYIPSRRDSLKTLSTAVISQLPTKSEAQPGVANLSKV